MSRNVSYGPWKHLQKPNVPVRDDSGGGHVMRDHLQARELSYGVINSGIGISGGLPLMNTMHHATIPAHSTSLTTISGELLMSSPMQHNPGGTCLQSPLAAQAVILQQQPRQPIDVNRSIDVYTPSGMQRLGQMYKGTGASVDALRLDDQNRRDVQHIVETSISNEGKQQIMQILERIALLQPPERLLLYLRLPSGSSETDPLRQPQNPLGTRSEINHTINWVRSHLQPDPNVSIAKQDVYDDYVDFCTREDIKPLSTADFGKVMKQIFPGIRPRRLGMRGHSRYCYAAMRKTTKLDAPFLPNLHDTKGAPVTMADYPDDCTGEIDTSTSWNVIKMWAKNLLDTDFENVKQMADFISTNYMNTIKGGALKNSKILLQKKLLHRKMKGKKKATVTVEENVEAPQNKRRKSKANKTQSLPQSKQNQSDQMDDNECSSTNTQVPDPSVESKTIPLAQSEQQQLQQQPEMAHHILTPQTSPLSLVGHHHYHQPQQQILPMNLTTNEDKIKLEQPERYTIINPVPYDTANICKTESVDYPEIEQTIFCKKVKRAHEEKGLLNPMSPMTQFIPPSPQPPLPQSSPQPQIPQEICPNGQGSLPERTKTSTSTVSSYNFNRRTQLEIIRDHSATTNVVTPQSSPALLPPPILCHQNHSCAIRTNYEPPLNCNGAGALSKPLSTSSEKCERLFDVPLLPPPLMTYPAHQLDTNEQSTASTFTSSNKRPFNANILRSKKFRFLKNIGSLSALNETKVDDITTDIIIPRERVISICSLDKDALDGYLNEGDNSIQEQEAEAELLQFFQPPPAVVTIGSNTSASTSRTTSVITTQPTVPILDNLQLNNSHQMAATSHRPNAKKQQEQINELRQYLQQNLQQNNQSNVQQHNAPHNLIHQILPPQPVMQPSPSSEPRGVASKDERFPSGKLKDVDDVQLQSNPGTIAAPPLLAMPINKRFLNSTMAATQKLNLQMDPQLQQQQTGPIQSIVTSGQPIYSHSVNTSSTTSQQSPNSRRKKFSFVPISPGPQSTILSTTTVRAVMPQQCSIDKSSPFVSPCATPVLRKQTSKDLTNTSDPMIGSYRTAFSKPNNLVSASAPTSPSSMLHQHFQFDSNQMSIYDNLPMSGPTVPITTINQQPVNAIICPSMMESRSQSVPLHCQSPAFNTSKNPTAYSSACTSISQTPAPSEFADFCDESILNILAETSGDQNLKLETENEISNLLDADLNTTNSLDQMLPIQMNEMRNHNIMSRSVPSTPLPHLSVSFGGTTTVSAPSMAISTANKFQLDISKSVPTTPITFGMSRGCTSFRYSPEHNRRDFLINGNSVEPKTNSFLMRTHSTQSQPTPIDSPGLALDELPNYGVVNDGILDSADLLNNL